MWALLLQAFSSSSRPRGTLRYLERCLPERAADAALRNAEELPHAADAVPPGRRAYVEQLLAPTLAAGDVVVPQNLSARRIGGVREAIKARAPVSSTSRTTRRTSTRSDGPSPS